MADEEIRIWSGTTPPNAFAYWSLSVEDEGYRPKRFKEFQDFAFGMDPQFIPLVKLIYLWKHNDKCPLSNDLHITDLIIAMIDHFQDENPWTEEKYPPKPIEKDPEEEEEEEEELPEAS